MSLRSQHSRAGALALLVPFAVCTWSLLLVSGVAAVRRPAAMTTRAIMVPSSEAAAAAAAAAGTTAAAAAAAAAPVSRKLQTFTWSVPTPPMPSYPCRTNLPTASAWRDIYVNPSYSGTVRAGTAAQPFKDFRTAWQAVGRGMLTQGVRILLSPGTVLRGDGFYMEAVYGSAAAPVLIMRNPAATGTTPVTFAAPIDVFNCTYLYFQDVQFVIPPCPPDGCGGDAVHFAHSDYITLSKVKIAGRPGEGGNQEALKVNQVQGIYIQDCDISGAADNAVDFVAVQYGHVCRTKIHHGNWCVYFKGGSSYLLVDSNEVYACGESGLSVGQGTGFEYMVQPWLQYEGYGIQVTNNIIRDVWGAGLGVEGGFNVLMAHNSLYKCGSRSHYIEFLFGSRSCDHDTDTPADCTANQGLGGWGPRNDQAGATPIPNKNVFFFNNLAVNPSTSPTQWSHFSAPAAPPPELDLLDVPGLPTALSVADNLVISGNVILNKPPPGGFIDLGLSACTDDNPSCNTAQVLADNVINTATVSYSSTTTLTLSSANRLKLSGKQRSIPAFPGWSTPLATPAGPLSLFGLPTDKTGAARTAANSIPGAYVL